MSTSTSETYFWRHRVEVPLPLLYELSSGEQPMSPTAAIVVPAASARAHQAAANRHAAVASMATRRNVAARGGRAPFDLQQSIALPGLPRAPFGGRFSSKPS